jgi:hypothetical protein
MTELTWRPIPNSAGAWKATLRPAPPPDGEATTDALAASLPERCPSGINGFSINKDDHIALFVFGDSTGSYLDIVLDYIAAGIDSVTATECLSLELAKNQSVESAEFRLQECVGRGLPSTVDIRGWERNAGDYTREHFDRSGMSKAMNAERARLDAVPNPMLRVASADCTAFMQWLSNPVEYIAYEHELADDLRRILGGRPFLQLCVFKVMTMHEIAAHNGFDAATALLDLALSHNRILLLRSGILHQDQQAEREILRATWPPKTRAGWTRWLRVAARRVGVRSLRLGLTQRRRQESAAALALPKADAVLSPERDRAVAPPSMSAGPAAADTRPKPADAPYRKRRPGRRSRGR